MGIIFKQKVNNIMNLFILFAFFCSCSGEKTKNLTEISKKSD